MNATGERAKKKLRIALPKGSLEESTLLLLRKAGFHFTVASRSYFPAADDDELEGMLIRAQEVAQAMRISLRHQG